MNMSKGLRKKKTNKQNQDFGKNKRIEELEATYVSSKWLVAFYLQKQKIGL